MVTGADFDDSRRASVAAAINARLVGLGNGCGISFDKFDWNFDLDSSHSGPHRLDAYFSDYVLRIYFADTELATYWGTSESALTDNRLHALVKRLADIIHAVNKLGTARYSQVDTRLENVGGYFLTRNNRRRAHSQ